MNLIERLIAIGYDQQQAEKVYTQYKAHGELNKLEDYVKTRELIKEDR